MSLACRPRREETHKASFGWSKVENIPMSEDHIHVADNGLVPKS